MTYGGMSSRPEATLLTERAAKYLENGPADVVDLIGHICNLPAAPRIVAEHMAHAMFDGRPEFIRDPLGRWTLRELPQVIDGEAGRLPETPKPGARRVRKSRRQSPVLPELPPQPLASMSWAVVDVETTGGPPPSHRITEIAAVFVRDGRITDVFESLVNPERSIPPFITRLTNISWDMVKNAPTFSMIASNLLDKLEGNVFVAHNAQFDWNFLSFEMNRVSGARLSGAQLCTVRLARRLLPQLPRRSLDHVANYYGVEITGRHRARGDAEATAKCLIRMLDHAADLGCTTWDDLDNLLKHRASRKKKRRSAWPKPVSKDTTA